MTFTAALRIAREFGLTFVRDHGHTYRLMEAGITYSAARLARISASEFRNVCSAAAF
jgi:hypothetical protein